jgi:hypothetical protein
MGENREQIILPVQNKLLKTLPFHIDDDPITTAKNWELWLTAIEREFRFFSYN